MTTDQNAIPKQQKPAILAKLYRFSMLVPYLSLRALTKPRYIGLCIWAFKELSWVDSRLKPMALEALKNNPADLQPAIEDPKLKAQIRRKAIAIYWTAKIHPRKTKCLHRSLVMYKWLKSQGLNPTLEIGWGKETSIGHAWVTYNGMVLNDRSDVAEHTPRLTKVVTN